MYEDDDEAGVRETQESLAEINEEKHIALLQQQQKEKLQ